MGKPIETECYCIGGTSNSCRYALCHQLAFGGFAADRLEVKQIETCRVYLGTILENTT